MRELLEWLSDLSQLELIGLTVVLGMSVFLLWMTAVLVLI